MKKNQLALQLYTLRDFLKTPAEIAVTLAKVKKIGYDVVQVSGMGAIDEAELVKICKNEGLTICATHENGRMIVEETQKVIDRLHKLNTKYTAYPFPHVIPTNVAETLALAKQLDAAAKAMAAADLGLCYHNHDIEFTKMENNRTMLDLLYADAPALLGEIDTFWVQAGGECPTAWVNKLANRMPLLHLKDMGIVNRERAMRPIGSGNLDWASIIHAGEKGKVEFFIVEQDCCQKDPFESVADSYRYLTENFVR